MGGANTRFTIHILAPGLALSEVGFGQISSCG